MSYRRRMELELERRQRRAMDERADRNMYYSHRLQFCEEILSRVYERPVTLVVERGWVNFNGRNFRVPAIEALAMRLDANGTRNEILGDEGTS